MKHSKSSNRRVTREMMKYMLIGTVGVVLILAGQISQYIASKEDARMHTISRWNDLNPDNEKISKLFISECLHPKIVDRTISLEKLNSEKPISVYECGESLEAQSLMAAMKKSDQSMASLSWPLSIFVTLE